ncbi:MAG: TnpV protein, partial [Clostridia bacterium]|nr:TnpV protein [Clostridia bacterium]
MTVLTSGKPNGYLADLNDQAENTFFRLVNELSEKEGITETLKADNQILWVQRMNTIRQTATEIVN